MDQPPPPPYSEQDPSQKDTLGRRTQFQRKPVTNSDTKIGGHANHDSARLPDNSPGHGYEQFSYKVTPNNASNSGQGVLVEDKVASDDDPFDLDDYYTKETEAEVDHRHVVEEDIKHPPRPGLSLNTLNISSRTYSSPGQLQHDRDISPAPSFLSATGSSVTLPLTPDSAKSSASSATKAFREARHFAGGIVQRPYESTKHITIVRHSHGLVFYQGNSTHIAITIFSDSPLPEGRRLWLQKKGWTGKSGARMDVTPKLDAKVEVHQLNESDERAWQRDIKTFRRKGPAKIREKHLPRETHIVGIPEESSDGYFMIILCMGEKKKVLCQSPLFRILSASRSPSHVKGAPVWAIPLEMGIKAGATALNLYAKNTVGRVTAVAGPVASVATGTAAKFMPKSFIGSHIATKAAGMASDAFSSAVADGNTRYNETRNQPVARHEYVEAVLNEGPKAPYPLTFRGRREANITDVLEELNMPNFGLTDISDHMIQQLHGYYFGWARVYEKKPQNELVWCQAIISAITLDITQLKRIKIGQAPTKTIGLRLMTDFEDLTLEEGVKFEVIVLGFIRPPDEPAQRAALEKATKAGVQDAIDMALISEYNDVSTAQQFLDHGSWSADVATRPVLEERKTSGFQKLSETYVNTRATAQKRIDQLGLHKLGVRLEGDQNRNKADVFCGYYVAR